MNVMDVYRSVVTGRRVLATRREGCACETCKRALGLLQAFLSHEQRAQLLTHGSFDVIAKSGTRYRIFLNTSFNVHRLDHRGQAVDSYCLEALGSVPPGDVLLSQKLMIEADEHRFHYLANRRVPC